MQYQDERDSAVAELYSEIERIKKELKRLSTYDSGSGGTNDHGELDGLADDDHEQYLNTTRHDTTDRHAIGDVVPHDATKVGKSGDETVGGIKTFSSIPVLPASDPTSDNQAVRKKYVDLRAGLDPVLYTRAISIFGGEDTDAESRRTVNITDTDSTYVAINGTIYTIPASTTKDLNVAGNWDTTAPTNYSSATNRAGTNFYIYACVPSSGSAPDIILSANSTVPSGYTADTSRKIGGFHCLCVSVGTIAGHDLTGYLQGDILPASVWDLLHRPKNKQPEGMVYSEKANIWVDIYLQSGTGVSTASAYGGTVTVSREWLNHLDDFAEVGKRMLHDHEFQIIAAGSNEETNITGSSAPGTTGGHSDTASRRMISNIGCEDCCGAYWQWLLTPSVRLDDGTAEKWIDLPNSKGSFNTYGSNGRGNTQLRAGGNWGNAPYCGSRSRSASIFRWLAEYGSACRACVEPL